MARSKTGWGTVEGTAAASIDAVLMDANQRMKVAEIADEIRRRGLPERNAIERHLQTLRDRGVIDSKANGWGRVGL